MSVRVIKKVEGRIDRDSRTVIDRLRVTAYARVSTNDDEQLNSYESQKSYYKDKIISNSEWEYVEIYADEAISGTLDYKRVGFMRMISDGLKGKFDMIMTKSISRFARNTVDTLKYVRKLKEKNVAVFFEEENINTLDMTGELLLTILSSVAQQESETISSHVKLGLKMKKERGELIGFNNCYGYHYNLKDSSFTIIEEQADVVRLIYSTYLEGYGCAAISKKLFKLGIKSPKNKDRWAETTISKILKNEKYIGDIMQGKTYTLDPISHKRVTNYGEEDKYYMENHHVPIVTRKDFEDVQELRRQKSGARITGRRLGNYGKKFGLSGKLKCGFCGGLYSRRTMRNLTEIIPIWKCVTSVNEGKTFCEESKSLREAVIQKAFIDVCKLMYANKSNTMKEMFSTIKKVVKSNSNNEKLEKAKQKNDDLVKKQSNLIDLMINGTIDRAIFEMKNKEFKSKIEKSEKEIEQYSLLVEDDDKIDEGLTKIKELIENKQIFNAFDEDMFDALIDYGIIGCIDEEGNKNPYIIKFLVKKSYHQTIRQNLTKERVLKSSNLSMCENLVIMDFISKQNFYCFEKKYGNNKRILMKGLRVIVEIEKED